MTSEGIRIMFLVAAFGNKVYDRARQSVEREAVLVSASPEEEAVRVAVEGLVERVQYLEAYSDEQVNILKLAHEEAVRQIEAVVKERDELRAALALLLEERAGKYILDDQSIIEMTEMLK